MLGPTSGAADTAASFNPVRAAKKAGKPTTPEQKKLQGACEQFESVMLGIVFKQMSASTGGSDELNKGAANQTWRDMLDDERAQQMTKAGGLGLADSIYQQLADRV